ncbi:MAG: hypothetical protein IKF11_10795 [Methanobrevibacter sp.]|nr:hypothetical protein [Methanobrevibacter sp.]
MTDKEAKEYIDKMIFQIVNFTHEACTEEDYKAHLLEMASSLIFSTFDAEDDFICPECALNTCSFLVDKIMESVFSFNNGELEDFNIVGGEYNDTSSTN